MKGGGAKKTRRRKRKINKRRVVPIVVAAAIAVLIVAALFVVFYYRVQTIRVEGNTRYTDEEIADMVVADRWTRNTLFLSMKYRNRSIDDIPFIERIDVQVTGANAVRIRVYEKSLAGYIEYLGQYMYFDREGVVVESSKERIQGVPQVLGLNFGYVVLYEKLPVENDEIFSEILSVTQLLDKYQLDANRIFFDASYNIYLYFGNIEAELGGADYIDEKLEQLVHILPELAERRGILRMKDYTPGSRGITFEDR